jgi:hypothetical protein
MSRFVNSVAQLAVFAALAGFSPAAFAYLDPSTGSMILSAIVGLFATVGLALKTYWYKIKGFFSSSESSASEAVTLEGESDTVTRQNSESSS